MSATDTNPTRTGYASVNGLELYYEIHGEGSGLPLVLLHGAMSATISSFGNLIPGLAQGRKVVSLEMQAHGHTADIDRPLTTEQMAADTVAALRSLGIEKADFFGYSMGSGIALQVAIAHPEIVGKLILASISYHKEGLHPGLVDGLKEMKPEMLAGSPWQLEYAHVAPNPDGFGNLVAKVTDLNMNLKDWTAEEVQSIKAPMLIVVADSDIVRHEHAVELFRLLGGGVMGEMAGLPASQLAILPGTMHSTVPQRADLLVPMVTAFLDR